MNHTLIEVEQEQSPLQDFGERKKFALFEGLADNLLIRNKAVFCLNDCYSLFESPGFNRDEIKKYFQRWASKRLKEQRIKIAPCAFPEDGPLYSTSGIDPTKNTPTKY